jgi:CrcB protein
MPVAYVIAGGALGTLLRYFVSLMVLKNTSAAFPWATFTVNLSGAFIIGMAAAFFLPHPASNNFKLFLITGILGGYTTFSALALESVNLFSSGKYSMALLYVAGTNIIGIILTFAGFRIGRMMFGI